MKAIVKNQTTKIISLYIGPGHRISVPASDGYVTGQIDLMNELTRDQLAKADDVMFYIKEGDIILNDGESDLSWLAAFDHVRNYRFKVDIQSKSTSDNRLRVAMEKGDSDTVTIYSHNWADRSTWYEGSVRVADEVAADSGDNITYTVVENRCVIDIFHGKITNEDSLLDSDGYSYRAIVKVNDEAKIEQDPHYGIGGDYTINYADGYVIFTSALQPSDEVKVTYHYADSSVFTIKPSAGKKLIIEVAEIQFSQDIDIRDGTRFDVYGLVDVFAPQLTPLPYPPGTLIPIRQRVYKTISDYQNDAVRAYASYPPVGGSSWRGMQQPVLIFDWDYLRGSILRSAHGMETRITLQHDEPFGGTFATATFYCSSEDES